jgi:hypothetical protein
MLFLLQNSKLISRVNFIRQNDDSLATLTRDKGFPPQSPTQVAVAAHLEQLLSIQRRRGASTQVPRLPPSINTNPVRLNIY